MWYHQCLRLCRYLVSILTPAYYQLILFFPLGGPLPYRTSMRCITINVACTDCLQCVLRRRLGCSPAEG